MNFSSWPSSISIMIIKGCNGNEAFGVNYYAGISDIIYGLRLNCNLQFSFGVSLTSSIGVNGLNQRVSYYSYILRTRVKNNVILINKTDHNKKLIGSKRVFEIHDLKTIQFGDLTKLDHFAKPNKKLFNGLLLGILYFQNGLAQLHCQNYLVSKQASFKTIN